MIAMPARCEYECESKMQEREYVLDLQPFIWKCPRQPVSVYLIASAINSGLSELMLSLDPRRAAQPPVCKVRAPLGCCSFNQWKAAGMRHSYPKVLEAWQCLGQAR